MWDWRRISLFAFLALVVSLPPGVALARSTYVTIGTGSVTGVYYPTGVAIAKEINRNRSEHHIRVTVEATRGSVYNVNAIAADALEFGIIQSDRQYQAYNGLADWQGQPVRELRSIFSIHPESVTIVANASLGIKTLADLKGRTVNIGDPGSGERGNAVDLLEMAGFNLKQDIDVKELKAAQSAGMLQDGHIDAFFYTVGHPNGSVREAVAGRVPVNFVEIPTSLIEAMIEKYPYYSESVIPIKLYPGVDNQHDVQTIGVRATLCTRAEMDEDIVYTVTRDVFENFEEFKSQHPSYQGLTKQDMLKGLTAPLHPGALRYYQEAGLK